MTFWGIVFRPMARLPVESAITLLYEYRGWFGSPALLRVHPSQIDAGNCGPDLVIDGAARFQAIAGSIGFLSLWKADRFPHFIFPHAMREGLWSTEGNKLLPRMLVLAGHHDRAWEYVPELWRTSPRDLQTFLNVPLVDALCVWAMRKRLRTPQPTTNHHIGECTKMIAKIRAGIAELDDRGFGFDIDDVRRIVR